MTAVGGGSETRVRIRGGLTLIEITIALALAAIVVALIGSLFAASLTAWRRGGDQREAQAQASVLVEVMARDIRGASQAPGVVVRPAVPAVDGHPLLAVASTAPTPGGGSTWVLYVQRENRGEVLRQTALLDMEGRWILRDARVVATGVEEVGLTVVAGGVTVEVRVRRGREVVTHRGSAAPRNP